MPVGANFSPLTVDSVMDRLKIKSSCCIAGFSYAVFHGFVCIVLGLVLHCVLCDPAQSHLDFNGRTGGGFGPQSGLYQPNYLFSVCC